MALAFASGSLITMLAFDLFVESFKAGGEWFSDIGFLGGAATFVAADGLLDRYIDDAVGSVSDFSILAAVTLDGVPEKMALSTSLRQGPGSLAPRPVLGASGSSPGRSLPCSWWPP